jgi:subtilisin family serine protease
MDYAKLSPTLAQAVDDYYAYGKPALASHNKLLGLVSVEEEAPRPAKVVVFLHVEEGTRRNAFADLGVELNQDEGAVRTGIVPLDSLDALTESGAVQRVVPARRLKPLMDIAGPRVGIPALHKGGLSGKNVVIGVIDTGIDVRNPAFKGRVLRIWDQTMSGPGVPEGKYGAELKGALMQTSQDRHGHGTHVSGIAAGADANYLGVAPKAGIVMVKSDLMTAHIADGVRYIFRVAKELKRPAVANLSLGGHGDSHDGTDSLSMVIDASVGPGRIVCCAAGNEGNDNIHAQAKVKKGSTRTFSAVVAIAQPNQEPPLATVNGWYDGKDLMDVAVVTPSGVQTPFQPVITNASPVKEYTTPNGLVRVMTPGPDPANGDINFFVQIEPKPPSASTTKPQSWKVRLRGKKVSNGTVDLWSTDETTLQFTGTYVKDSMKVGAPGAATQAITVASFTTRAEWDAMMGSHHDSGLENDTISDFSSEGPRRDGAPKPEVAAPGAMIVSALSSKSPVSPAILIDDWNRINAGTSMACPFVAGTVALLLERDKNLDPDGVKKLLADASAIPGKKAGTWDPKWGHGLIDAKKL